MCLKVEKSILKGSCSPITFNLRRECQQVPFPSARETGNNSHVGHVLTTSFPRGGSKSGMRFNYASNSRRITTTSTRDWVSENGLNCIELKRVLKDENDLSIITLITLGNHDITTLLWNCYTFCGWWLWRLLMVGVALIPSHKLEQAWKLGQ